MSNKKFYPKHWFNRDENAYPSQRVLSPRETIRSEIDRIFDNFFTPFWGFPESSIPRGPLTDFARSAWQPSLDLHETDKGYDVAVELPGVDENDITIELNTDNTLIIRGEKKEETSEEDKKAGRYRTERYYGSFSRTLLLPNDCKTDDITASFDKGVLKIAIPKGECKDTKRIPITAAKA